MQHLLVKLGAVAQRLLVCLFLMQIFNQKLISDRDEMAFSSHVSSLDEFVINFMMFKFGHKNIVKTRLASLINSVFEYQHSDKLINLFAQFCGLLVRYSCLAIGLYV